MNQAVHPRDQGMSRGDQTGTIGLSPQEEKFGGG